MADPLVSAIFATIMTNLNNEALKQYALLAGVNTELKKLRRSFNLIQGVLTDAEAKQWNSDGEAVKRWLRDLKNAAYDADDVLDEFDIKVETRQRRRGLKNQMRSFFSLHHNPIAFRMEMARKLKNVREELDEIHRDQPLGLQRASLPEGRSTTSGFPLGVPKGRLTTSLPESGICGRDDQKEKLIQDLVSSSEALSIHALCGIGGLGKTTLAKLVYNDAETIERHFDLRMWVCVSDDTDSKRLTRAIIESIGGDTGANELDTLQRRLREKVNGKKFLLVLDDVWDDFPVEWGTLKSAVESGATGSVVLITTRIRQVAEKMYAVSIRYMERLSEDDSWSLFALHAFRMREPEEFMVTIGKCIVKKCGGVPLVLTVLGSSMHLKTEEKQWLDVMASELWDLADEGKRILATLTLSYTHLTMNLRQCFSYCCIFPKDYVMKKEVLIQLWMANDFIISRGGCKGLHETGKEIFDELVARSFFQNVEIDYLGNTSCKLHDLLHDVAMSVMAHEIHSIQPGENLDGTKHYRHVSVSCDERENYGIKGNSKIPSLRSFIQLFIQPERDDIEKVEWLSTQKYLRILRCECNYLLLEKLSLSKHLRYLKISSISRLPESICSLYKLQTLDLTDCEKLQALPKGMKEMKSLVYLDIKYCFFLQGMPHGMGQLKGLRKLSNFIVGEKDGCKIGELKELNGLEGELRISRLCNVKSVAEAESANLMGKKMLTSLQLIAGTEWGQNEGIIIDMEILSALQPYQNLKKLSISGYGNLNLPDWMMDIHVHLPHLVEIKLEEFSQCQHLSIPLGRLNSLKVLRLGWMPCLQHIGVEVYGVGERAAFPLLEKLTLYEMSSLTEWAEIASSSKGALPFPRLREASIVYCPLLTKFPVIPSLQDLFIAKSTVTLPQLRVLVQANFIGLKSLKLQHCHQLESLSELDSQHNNVCCLEKLDIDNCNKLQSLPSPGLWCSSSLRHLSFKYCKEFITSSEDGLRHLTALQTLRFDYCPKMTSLSESIQHLTALQTLTIVDCNGLSCLPDGIRSLTTLATLSIWGCPDLERRCEKEKGEDWPKIAHIPSIRINRKQIQ